MTVLLLLLGFALLIKGADFFVDGASSLAAALRVSPMLIGLTVVAFGTSAPEASVSLVAALEGSSEVALGNVVGSNLFNTTLILGVASLIYPLVVKSETIRKEIPFALLAGVVLLVLISDVFLLQAPTILITRSEGIVLLLFFVIFLYYVFEVARNNRELDAAGTVPVTGKSMIRNLAATGGGIAGIVLGGHLVVQSSVRIALSLGMSQTLVGLTIVAVGTSLPELVTSITAALKGQTEIALGNVIGSNIFNVLFILGISAAIHPLSVDPRILSDVWLLIFLTIVVLFLSRTHHRITRKEGAFLTSVYVVYLVLIILRN